MKRLFIILAAIAGMAYYYMTHQSGKPYIVADVVVCDCGELHE